MAQAPRTGPPSTQLRKDFGIFFEGGFLSAVALCFLLGAITGALMLLASTKYGIPPITLW